MRGFSLLLVPILASVPAMASTLLVLPDGSGPYPDLQAAVIVAADGDTILLGDGIFTGEANRNLTLTSRSLTFASHAGVPDQCVVDLAHVLGAEARFLVASGSADDRVVVRGIELRNGATYSGSGGAIRAEGLAIDLADCVVRDSGTNGYEGGGGAVFQLDGSFAARRCVFLGNSGDSLGGSAGGAIVAIDADVVIQDCTFNDNTAHANFDSGARGGAIAIAGGSATIDGSTFLGNAITPTNMGMNLGGAVYAGQASLDITGCLFVDNFAYGTSSGGALAIDGGHGAATSCTFAHNGAANWHEPEIGGTVYVSDAELALARCIITGAQGEAWEDPPLGNAAAARDGIIAATDCNVWGNGEDWTGPLAGQHGHDGNFSADPCFCDASAGDHHLCADSWCAPEHNVAHPGVLVGALPVGCEACGCTDGPTAVAGDLPAPGPRLSAQPNPFNPTTEVRFTLATAGPARLTLHDPAGHRVATLADGSYGAGDHVVTWRGRDDHGNPVAGGLYLLRLEAGDEIVQGKLTLLR